MKNLIAPLALAASPAFAEAPRVVTDIAPVHALVAQVMEGVGTPDLVIPANASPHNFAMRPAQAQLLSDADAVIWIGHGLTPWLEGPVERLAPTAANLELIEVAGIKLLPFRESALFEGGAHDHGAEGHDEHGHDDEKHDDENHDDEKHDDHGHEEHGDKDEKHADGHDDHEGHADHDKHDGHADHDKHEGHADHGADASDPHVWLSPANGALFLTAISEQLSAIDPDNAATYAENAAKGREAIAAVEGEINAMLTDARGNGFIVLHDAFHYFEDHFDIEALGAISPSDAAAPGAKRIAALRAALPDSQLKCAFSEPQTNGRIIETVIEGMDVQTEVLDPLGSEYEIGSALYPALLKSMAASISSCLTR